MKNGVKLMCLVIILMASYRSVWSQDASGFCDASISVGPNTVSQIEIYVATTAKNCAPGGWLRLTVFAIDENADERKLGTWVMETGDNQLIKIEKHVKVHLTTGVRTELKAVQENHNATCKETVIKVRD